MKVVTLLNSKRLALTGLTLALLYGVALVLSTARAPAAQATAMTGSKAWAVVLCQFSDSAGVQPHNVQWYQDFVTHSAPNHDGLWDFWHDVSYGKMDLNGSQVFGWNTLPNPVSYYKTLPASSDPRAILWRDCADTATSVDFTKFYGVLAMLNVQRDSGAVQTGPYSATLNGKSGAWGAVVLDPAGAQNVSWGAHEMGHGFGLSHNYDIALSNCLGAAKGKYTPGEYCDPFDAMGYESGPNTFATSFGPSSPGLTAPQLAKLGWVTPTIVDPSTGSHDEILYPIEKQGDVLQVPIVAVDDYYTIEFRDPTLAYQSGTKWGQNLPGPAIIIHEAEPDGLYYLIDNNGGPAFKYCQSFSGKNGIRILVLFLPQAGSGTQAQVRIENAGNSVPDPADCSGNVAAPTLQIGTPQTSGQGLFQPTIVLGETEAHPGDAITISGNYFNAQSTPDVWLNWSGGSGELQQRTSGGSWQDATYQTQPDGQEEVTNLAPATQYEFQVRSCDALGCSPYSNLVGATSGGPGTTTVSFYLDSIDGQPIGSATLDAGGNFSGGNATIPAGTTASPAGTPHQLYATTGGQITEGSNAQEASAAINVISSSKALQPVIELIDPSVNEVATIISPGIPFIVKGQGFPDGTVTISLGTAGEQVLGTATASGGNFQTQVSEDTIENGSVTIVASAKSNGKTVKATVTVTAESAQ